MKNRFIALIDFSDYSINQIKIAKQWSEITNGEVILVHQTTPLFPTLTDQHSKEQIKQQTNLEAREKLILLANKTVGNIANFGFLASEKEIETILEDLTNTPNYNNILLLGLRGTNNTFRKLLIGSFALELIENSKITIVTLPKNITQINFDEIFIATNKNYPLNSQELIQFLKFFGQNNPTINLFSILQKNESTELEQHYLEQIKSLLVIYPNVNTNIIEGENVLEEINNMLSFSENKHLLVLQKGSRLLIDKLFRRFLINDLMHEGNHPVVILP